MTEFVAIDLETANSNMASICQIGIVKYQDGEVIEEWTEYINPEEHFDGINISIHGVTENDISKAPKLPEVFEKINELLSNTICVSHTHFDRVSINKALQKYSLPPIETQWLDSSRVARRTWEEFAYKGYGLANVCKKIGFEFKHHDALEDAKACGAIILSAIKETATPLEQWPTIVNKPINVSPYPRVTMEGNPDGPLFGASMVFTGALTLPRKEVSTIASMVGCKVTTSVNKKTNFLVVGDQDVSRLAGYEKSSKHRKAEGLIQQGVPIRVIKESDFRDLVEAMSIK